MRHNRTSNLCLCTLIAATLGGCAAQSAKHSPAARAQDPLPRSAATTPPPLPAAPRTWERIGTSTQGRPIEATTIGMGGTGGTVAPRVLLVGGIHGDEPEGGRTIDAVEAYLRTLRPGATVRIVRDANPDGTAARSRHSRHRHRPQPQLARGQLPPRLVPRPGPAQRARDQSGSTTSSNGSAPMWCSLFTPHRAGPLSTTTARRWSWRQSSPRPQPRPTPAGASCQTWATPPPARWGRTSASTAACRS
ncbi:MAG: hypothetical protein HND58_01800 [Planctomycetota bacterium]|nr:MAG: hypothetical protein HND58_01800 [Planctomycetota bacterium]